MRLGDAVKEALDLMGIDQREVELWLGHPCNCQERQEKLNAIGAWARRTAAKGPEGMKRFLRRIISGAETL